MENLGIEAIKNGIGAGFGLTNKIAEITAESSAGGKKVTLPELIGSVGEVYDIARAALQAKQIYAEVQDLTDEEQKELELWVEQTLNVPNDKTKKIIVQSLVVVMEIGELVFILTAKDGNE